jgi:hypothetical protein
MGCYVKKILAVLAAGALFPLCASDNTRFGSIYLFLIAKDLFRIENILSTPIMGHS